jgi:phosphatidylglycerophosphate synthase
VPEIAKEKNLSVSAMTSEPQLALGVSIPSQYLKHSRSQLNTGLAVLTLARLSLVPVIVLSFMKVPAVTVGAIVLFVIADVLDGVLARSRQADGPARRALDSTIDRIGIDAGILGAFVAGLLPAPLLIALLARDAYCAVICARMVKRRGVAIKADWLYRGLNLCVAAGALAAPFVPTTFWVWSAGVLLIISVIVAIDLTRLVRKVESAPPGLSDMVLPAGAVRSGDLSL